MSPMSYGHYSYIECRSRLLFHPNTASSNNMNVCDSRIPLGRKHCWAQCSPPRPPLTVHHLPQPIKPSLSLSPPALSSLGIHQHHAASEQLIVASLGLSKIKIQVTLGKSLKGNITVLKYNGPSPSHAGRSRKREPGISQKYTRT